MAARGRENQQSSVDTHLESKIRSYQTLCVRFSAAQLFPPFLLPLTTQILALANSAYVPTSNFLGYESFPLHLWSSTLQISGDFVVKDNLWRLVFGVHLANASQLRVVASPADEGTSGNLRLPRHYLSSLLVVHDYSFEKD
ncbi:uncharacterized protein LACBIDRAFT_333169 [Laccaria bicolor S238N-H82]|uniref:Predicted protein n=1 Tax=Laccaria bicolor (strain S238N-H82 / ATCC MYA-4686) TaxID=486041 RepID=B0DV41_LACBS|nr:uncharacterized protein LACBIDRAFT_333169 [Laccaria bicolor S238N-H82]EDR01446.1 predicted protein [Laccaria bicolor S238N-H82]|eukprot:XP_001887798.1 predicted protein [Laccaria bicolor S238N-H82]